MRSVHYTMSQHREQVFVTLNGSVVPNRSYNYTVDASLLF